MDVEEQVAAARLDRLPHLKHFRAQHRSGHKSQA
jgi:hypothetical protein